MKKSIKLFFAIAITQFYFNLVKAQSVMEKWPQAKTFHEVMSKTFHPSEEGNLEPIKTRIGEMVKKAEDWANTKAPEGFDKPTIKAGLANLVKESKELEKEINSKASDETIKKELSNLHEVFHGIIGECNGEKHGEHHDEKNHK